MLCKILGAGMCVAMVAHGLWACGQSEDREPEPEPTLCPGQSFAGVEPAGIWHFHATYAPTVVVAEALRFEKDGGQYTAWMLQDKASRVTVDQSGVEVVMIETDLSQDQPLRTVTLRLCDMDEDGTATGIYQHCNGEQCVSVDATAHKIEPLDEPVSAGLTLIAEYNGPAGDPWPGPLSANVRVHKGKAYVARRYDGLRIVDLVDPAVPRERGHVPVMHRDLEDYNDIKIKEGPDGRVYALMASDLRGVVVVDASDPDAPFEVTSFPRPGNTPDGLPAVHTLFIEGDRAYLAYTGEPSGLHIYDVSKPDTPRLLGRWSMPGGTYLHDLYVQAGRAYLNYWDAGLVIVDTMADPMNPRVVGEFKDYGEMTSHSNWVTRAGGRTISLHGDEQYGAHVRIVDVDDTSPGFLEEIGSYGTRPEVSVHNILAHADNAYVTYYQDGLRVLDLHDPINPREIAHYNTWPGAVPGYGDSFFEGAIGVDFDPATGMIYVMDTHRGLFVLELAQ